MWRRRFRLRTRRLYKTTLRHLADLHLPRILVLCLQMRSCLLLLTMLAATMLQAQPPEDEKVYKVGGSVSRPRTISKVVPEYTQEALRARREGNVDLQVVVTRDGVASDIHGILQPL